LFHLAQNLKQQNKTIRFENAVLLVNVEVVSLPARKLRGYLLTSQIIF
jgi:hypothetical protein